MPRGQQATTVVDRPLRTTRKNGGADQVVQKPPRTKRVADENAGNEAKSRKRAAFGDLTNATTEKNSFTKQVKKGLSNIVNLSRGTVSSSNSEVNAKKIKLAAAVASTTKAQTKPTYGKRKSSTEAISLPSSQEIKIKIDETKDEESEYESAEENVNDDTVVIGPVVRHRYEPPARLLPPPGVEDFDKECGNDPNVCSEYAMDIFNYYKSREAQFRVPDYISRMQPEVTKMMRAILVDWLVEVQESFELNHETLYTAVKILDIYMSQMVVNKEDLQLVGATACLIACKIDERVPPCLDDFVYVCDDAYSRTQIKDYERKVLGTVGFDVGYPLSYRFVRRYGRVCKASMDVLTYARYILETALLEYKFNVAVSESKLAAAALVLAFKVNKIDNMWVNTLAFYSGYTPSEVADLVQSLFEMLKQYPKENLKTVRQKYSHRVFHEVATIPLPNTIDLNDLVCDFEVKKEEDFENQTEKKN
jgi:hypothetical protein